MKTILIKRTGATGRDTKMFRAYEPVPNRPDAPLGVSASTTGNSDWGARSCAVKAFIKFEEPNAEVAELQTRVALQCIVPDMIWSARLQPYAGKTAADHRTAMRKEMGRA